ncbi:winged helix-turn-helix domain-containing protein [Streptomyces sp. NBC_00247]|uniref:AfsR/SARP family transcriptional regulator n=1 Tax=Streptomyces sp. NBC_00247 TaxID=2975689 RepID=UPI002E2B780E|nr:BTAD domain-containing putative transcriptional regulator [Streptomyces sp. NBC_00247]
MRYCILGTTQALRDDGTAVALGGARLRALLTVLALSPGRAVPVAVLVDEVWDGEPPADAPGAVQALVGRLRRALGRDAIASDENGYRLAAEPEAVDLRRFERLTGEGSRALEAGDGAKALDALDAALALWHGPAFADLPDRAAVTARWEARRLAARRARGSAYLALGRAEEALPELVALCADHPLDEPLQALRIRALHRAGRTAQALAAYEEVRTLLAARLGTDPGAELRSLHTELLHHDSAPPVRPGPTPGRPDRPGDRPAAPARPLGPDARTPASGVPEARTPSGRTAAPVALAPLRAPSGNLRARLTSFVGREADIAALREDLGRSRLVTLLGPGGAGKTRLSQEAAETIADAWPDGVWMAELAPVDSPEAVPEAVLSALDARETVLRGAGAEEMRVAEGGTASPLVRLTEHCARRRMLLLLDNCEHVVGAAAALADHLLARCPDVTVLATSREPLGVPGEFVRPVEPLPDPTALRLFEERGHAARPGFRSDADPATAAASAEICRRLDGLPLAIELAAARLRMLSPRQIADRLDDRFRLLSSGSRTLLPRQQTLRAVVDWSWDLLDAAERAVLRRMSVFAGGCSLAAAEAVCSLSVGDFPGAYAGITGDEEAVDVRDVAVLLGSLVDKSLVVAEESGDGEMRYRLLETVGEYASERLDEAGERAAVDRCHLVYYRELARAGGPRLRGPGQRAALELFRREYENLRTAFRHAAALEDEHECLCIILSMGPYWMLRDLRDEARQWADTAAALGPDPFAPPGVPAPPLHERSTDKPPPMEPDQLMEARRGVRLIQIANMDHEMDLWMTEESMERLRIIARTYRPGQPQTCRSPGSLWVFAVILTGERNELYEVMDETVRTCRQYGYEWELGSALQMRANLLANQADSTQDARVDADESLEIFTRLQDAWGSAEALASRGEANEQAGKYQEAAEDYLAAMEYAEQLGAQSQVAVLRARYANILAETDRTEEAEAILRDVIGMDRTSSGHEATPFARMHLGMLLGRTGRITEARAQMELLAAEFNGQTLAIFEGFVMGVVAWLDNEEGLYAQALGHAIKAVERANDRLAQMVAPQMTSIHLVTAAWALAGLGAEDSARDAARLLGTQAARLSPLHVPTTVERQNLVKAGTAARAVIGDAAYEAAYAEGGRLSLEEATALAVAHNR